MPDACTGAGVSGLGVVREVAQHRAGRLREQIERGA